MYDYITGQIIEINLNNIILENNKIGYMIFSPNPYNYKINTDKKIYIYNHVREQENLLYGFETKEERILFLKLIDVKGLGCKTAINLLSRGPENIISSIETENITYLKKFPKVGDKLARQIILDLKGKLVINTEAENNDIKELKEALKSLGYKPSSIETIIKDIDPKLKLEDQIKEALKKLLK